MNSASSDPHAQSAYQVRFDWGRSGADAIGRDVEAIVWVDELGAAPIPDLPLGPAVVAAGLDSAGSLAASSFSPSLSSPRKMERMAHHAREMTWFSGNRSHSGTE